MMKMVRGEVFLASNRNLRCSTDPEDYSEGEGVWEECLEILRLFGAFFMGGIMEERVALIGIVVEKYESAERLNQILHEYGEYIIGRMGIPYKEKSMNIISVAVDAPMDVISTLSGKLGMLDGVSSKTIYAKSKKG